MSGAMLLLALGALAGGFAMELLRGRRLARRLQVVARCCHELRGALTTINSALGGLERGSRADPLRVEALRLGYERALVVAADLEAARGRKRAAIQRPEPFDLHEVARRVVETWSACPPAARRPVSLEWRAGHTLVYGYRLRLAQALDNLVANAVEHGRGPVTVIGRVMGDFVSVSVLDRGGGLVRPLDQARARSWQARRGHGLVIAQHAVELHGGTLRAVRGPSGAGVEIRLPAGTDAAPVRATPPPVPSGRTSSSAEVP
jgi:signal transduction histidine kinase